MPETAIFNIDIGTIKKNVKKKKYPQVLKVLKKFIVVTTITKRILNLGISLIVSKLLAFALAIKKQLKKTISEDKSIQFYIKTLKLAEVGKAFIFYSWYFLGSPKIQFVYKIILRFWYSWI